jgi:hypothetical protein
MPTMPICLPTGLPALSARRSSSIATFPARFPKPHVKPLAATSEVVPGPPRTKRSSSRASAYPVSSATQEMRPFSASSWIRRLRARSIGSPPCEASPTAMMVGWLKEGIERETKGNTTDCPPDPAALTALLAPSNTKMQLDAIPSHLLFTIDLSDLNKNLPWFCIINVSNSGRLRPHHVWPYHLQPRLELACAPRRVFSPKHEDSVLDGLQRRASNREVGGNDLRVLPAPSRYSD